MIATVTNLTTHQINYLDTYTLGYGLAGGSPRGGARKYPLPHPFGHLVLNANGLAGDHADMPFYAQDLEYRPYTGAVSPRDELNKLIQNGTISLSFAASTPRRSVDEVFYNGI